MIRMYFMMMRLDVMMTVTGSCMSIMGRSNEIRRSIKLFGLFELLSLLKTGFVTVT